MTESAYQFSQEPTTLESVDDRMISLMRLILALSALLIIYVDPSEPDRFVVITYGSLVFYSVYSAVLYVLSISRNPLLPNKISHWIDVGCFLVIVALSSGTSSIFFYFFFFSILVASFRWGFKAGFRVTLASALLFTTIGYATAPAGRDFELNRFLLRPVYLLVLGYMIAYWGGHEIKLRRRLSFLKDVTTLSNPRFSVSQTAGSMLSQLLTFYDADDSLLIMADLHSDEPRLFRLPRTESVESLRAEMLPPNLAQLLLAPPEEVALVHKGKRDLHSLRHAGNYVFDLNTKKECTIEWQKLSESLAGKLDVRSFISVPLQYRGKAIGRLYLMARGGIFDNSDFSFLMQVVEQIMPIIHNIKLLDRLATNAAEQERQRLARDIHDSVVQPYIGLQYKLAAIRNKIAAGANVTNDIEHLFQMTVNEVNSLRGFTRGLKDKGGPAGSFLAAVRRFAAQFGDNYDLSVLVESQGEINITDRLAAELIQIVQEGLSNIRKHTEATRSKIILERVNGFLQLCIENDVVGIDDVTPDPFYPRSITERAEELGGCVDVERSHNRTAVRVKIPL